MAMRSTKDLKDIVSGSRASTKTNGIAGNVLTESQVFNKSSK